MATVVVVVVVVLEAAVRVFLVVAVVVALFVLAFRVVPPTLLAPSRLVRWQISAWSVRCP